MYEPPSPEMTPPVEDKLSFPPTVYPLSVHGGTGRDSIPRG